MRVIACRCCAHVIRHRRRRHGDQAAQRDRPEVVVQRLRQTEVAEDHRGRRRDGGKNVHAHHVHAQAVPDGIRAHRVSAQRVFAALQKNARIRPIYRVNLKLNSNNRYP